MNVRLPADIGGFDLYTLGGNESIQNAWQEPLWSFDWTVDPAKFAFTTSFTPFDYTHGQLAESWEITNGNTYIFHLRKGIMWQNITPANGREFTAADVAFHFDRQWGLAGYKPSAFLSPPVMTKLTSCVATDKYTVTFTFTGASEESVLETILEQGKMGIECSDVVNLYGNTANWHYAIGTGPFILQDFVSGGSATLIKNTNYWGYDERHPQNRLPYIDTLRYLIIPDTNTALAALRTGKIDVMDGLSLQNSKDLKRSSPNILQKTYPPLIGESLDPRNDVAPFSDIRVREAMQLAIDLPTIASSYYSGTVDPAPESFVSIYLGGWGWPYSQWPQDLKDEYAYNPTKAKALLTAAGYPNGFNTDVVASDNSDLDLLQIVQSYLQAVGINMAIKVMPLTDWVSYVQTARKHDALAYKNQGCLGKTNAPADQLQTYWSGNTTEWSVVNDPNYDALVTKALASTTSASDFKQVLTDMTKLVAQQHYSIALNNPVSYVFYQPWLKGYSGQANSISGIFQAGPSPYFYLARFWIDGSLK
jgi:peptide/nickel transport system substrate-binding protein